MDTPFFTRTIAVPADTTGWREPVAGRYVKIVSCSVASVLMGFDGQAPQRVYAGDAYRGPEAGFRSLKFLTDLGACTVVVQVSGQPISGGDVVVAPAMAASLASIDQEISGAAADPVTGQLVDTICNAAAPGTPLFAANPARTEIEITADLANGAEVIYLGITNARCVAADKIVALAAGDSWSSVREKGAIFATSSAGTGVVSGREC